MDNMQEIAAQKAQLKWDNLPSYPIVNNPYLISKGLSAYNVRQDLSHNLIIPVKDVNGKLWSYQAISPKGTPWFLTGSRTKNCLHELQHPLQPLKTIHLYESYMAAATAMQHGVPNVCLVFYNHNFFGVTTALREKYPNTKIEVCPNNNLASIKEASRCLKIAKVKVLTSEAKPCL